MEPKILFDTIYFWSVLRNSVDWAIFKLFHVIRACGGLVPSQHVRARENILYFQLHICQQQKGTDKAIRLCLAPVWITVDSWKNLNESIALLLATYQQVIEREKGEWKAIYKINCWCVSYAKKFKLYFENQSSGTSKTQKNVKKVEKVKTGITLDTSK